MLSNLLTEQKIRTGLKAEDWRQAAQLAGGLLEEAGEVESRYVQAILETVEFHGAYMVLIKGFALVHARPEDGALCTGASLITLQPAVEFGAGEKDPVTVVMAFASPDSDAHVMLIQDVALLLMKEGCLEALCACATPADIMATIHRFEGGAR